VEKVTDTHERRADDEARGADDDTGPRRCVVQGNLLVEDDVGGRALFVGLTPEFNDR